LVNRINIFRLANNSVYIFFADNIKFKFLGYTRCYCTIIKIQKIIITYIVPGNINYSLILKRLWFREVEAIGLYAYNKYYIKNDFNNYYKLEAVGRTNFIPVILKIILGKKVYRIRVRLS